MLSCVLAVLTCAVIPVSDPLEIAAVMPPESPTVEVGSYFTSTTFRCRNFSNDKHLLVFGRAGVATPEIVTLLPGCTVAYSFAPEALPGVMLEVVAVTDKGLTTSGAVSLALPAGSDDQSLWNVPGSQGLLTWQQIGCEVYLVLPHESMLPSGAGATGPGAEAMSASTPPIAVPRTTPGLGSTPPQYTPM